jgi:hypothetical protein
MKTALLALMLCVFTSLTLGHPPQQRAAIRIFIVPGYAASADQHWFADIKQQLQTRQLQVEIISFPDATHPDVKRWQETLATRIPAQHINQNTYFVAHSLGQSPCCTIYSNNRSKSLVASYWSRVFLNTSPPYRS